MIGFVVGGLVVLVPAYRTHILWGLAGLAVCLAIVGGVLAAIPTVRERIISSFQQARSDESKQGASGIKDLTVQIQEHRDHIERLNGQLWQSSAQINKQYKDLTAKRAALKANDTEAITQFNVAAASYKSQNEARKAIQSEIQAAEAELEKLLAERSKLTVKEESAHPKVVMYGTSTCPACQAARHYFESKGVRYEEKNLEESAEARAEFGQLNGSGIPLIFVGKTRMEGFNGEQLDQLLKAS